MGALKQEYDSEEEQRLSAQKRAEQRWGMSPDDDGEEEGQEEPTGAREKASKKWGMDNEDSGGQKTAKAEASADDTEGNGSATNNDEKSLMRRSVDQAKEKSGYNGKLEKKKNNKKKYLAGGIFASLAISAVGVAAFLPTIMTNIIVDQLTDTFLGRAKYAIRERAEIYSTRYVTQVIGGELRGTCGTTVNKDCVNSTTLMGKLTEQWKNNRLEEKLFTKYGLEFELDVNDRSKIRVLQNGLPLDGTGDFGNRSVSKKVIKSINTETKFDSIITRRHIRSVLANKYGAKKFCIIACAKRDSIETKKIGALRRLKLKIYSQVAEVGASRTSAYLLCLTVNCSDADLRRSENEIAEKILSRQSDEFIKELAEDIDNLAPGSRKLSNLVIERAIKRLLLKAGVQVSGKVVTSLVPLAGQIYLAATAAEFITSFQDKLENREISKYMRKVNNQEAALFATQIINIKDDNHSRQASFEDQWASFQLLNGFAESRVWESASGDQARSTVSCNNGVVLKAPTDPLTCPEMKLQHTLAIEEIVNDPMFQRFSSTLSGYTKCLIPPIKVPGFPCGSARTVVRPTLKAINATLGFVGNQLFTVAGAIIPGLDSFVDLVSNFVGDNATQFLTWASDKVLIRVTDPDAEDQLALDQTAMGLDVLGNQFAKGDTEVPNASSIQGKLLSAEEQASLDVAILERKREEKQDMSVFARFFDINNTESLSASIALATATALPFDGQPLNLPSIEPSDYLNTFAVALGLSKKSSAALSVQDRSELFDVSQYGYDVNSGDLAIDPDTLTPEVCDAAKRARLESEFTNERTGEKEYTEVNICAIDEVVIDSLNKIYELDAEGAAVEDGSVSAVGTGQLNCQGYTAYSLTSRGSPTPATYDASTEAACLSLKNQCQSVGELDTVRILCEAFKYDGVPYGNSYGKYSGSEASSVYGFSSTSGNFGINAESWQKNRSEGLSPNNLLECSGLTSVALYDAFDYDGKNIGCSGNYTERNNPTLFRQLPQNEIKAGDFLTKSFGCNSASGGHVAIAAGPVDSSGNILVYETNQWGKPTRFNTKSLSYFQGGWSRYIGPGSE
jgi:hypothetical protein